MKVIQKKILIATAPFLFFIVNMFIIGILSDIESDPLDSDWKTRQIILALYVFTGISFLPRLLQLSTQSNFPFLKANLSHHSPQHRNSHELPFYDILICTGCVGTTCSIILGSLILLLYLFTPYLFSSVHIIVLFILGIGCMLITFSRYFIFLSPSVRLVQHSTLFLSLAFFIILNDIIFTSAFLVSLLLPSWLFFLLVRIQLSKIDHSLV
jgi:hypothetical protein